MRFPAVSFLCAFVGLTPASRAAQPCGYDWMDALPSARVVERAANVSRIENRALQAWRLSVGYAVRQFEADFLLAAPDIALLAPYLMGGLSDVGTYRGGYVDYEDGFVGPGNGDGTAGYGSYDSNVDGQIFAVGSGIDIRGTKTFHTTGYAMLNSEASDSDHAHGVGPFVRLSQTLAEFGNGSFGISIAWSNTHGLLEGATVFGHPQRSRYAYTYDSAFFMEPFDPGGGSSEYYAFGLVTNAAQVNATYEAAFGKPGTFRNPRSSVARSAVTEWTALGNSSLDVRLNEIFLSADMAWKPWPGWEAGVSAGPTLNVVSATLNTRAAWLRDDGLLAPEASSRQMESYVAVGAAIQATVRRDLAPDGRAFLEAHAAFKWVEDMAIGSGANSANLDLTDWEVGLGVGIRLDDWPAGSPWTVKLGANARTLSFTAGPGSKSALRTLFDRRGGRGEVGFFNGRETIQYDDGRIFGNGSGNVEPGFNYGSSNAFSIDSHDQVNLQTIEDPWWGSLDVGRVAFHSSAYREALFHSDSLGLEDERTLVTPLVELTRRIVGDQSWSLACAWGWSATGASFQVGPGISGVASTRRRASDYTYSYAFEYDADFSPDSADHYPYVDAGLIADPRRIGPRQHYRPHKSESSFQEVLRYFPFTAATTDVSAQTISFAADLAWRPVPRIEVGVSVGPTFNLFHTSTYLTTAWVREDGLFLARLEDHDGKNTFRVGLRLLATASYDLSPDGRWFLEARGGYEWLEDIDLGVGLQAATLVASSWQVGGAIGCRLGVKPKLREIRSRNRPARTSGASQTANASVQRRE